MGDKPVILVADDEADVRELVGSNLIRAGLNVIEAQDGVEALRLIREHKPDAVVLDLMMPGRDGLQVCEELRAGDKSISRTPIVMLTAKNTPTDRIAGLEQGVDDYVAKPFSPRELVLRVKAVLRRAGESDSTELKEGPFHFDLPTVRIWLNGELLDLTLIEFKLLHLLALNRGNVVERDTILSKVWGYSENVRTRTLDTHMKRLREKLGPLAEWVQTARGFGYMFEEPK